jgi:Glycosyl transferase 4-like domain
MPTLFIASPYFPPSALPPSQRVRLLVRHLQEMGWKTVVFTVEPRYREENPDPWMIEIAGNQFEKIIVKAWDQKKTRKFGVGDLGIRMFGGLFRSMLAQVKKEKPDLILFPVPPWYIMVMAPMLKKITKVPYVIDYIDPWLFELTSRNPKAVVSQWLARRLEGFVLRRSSAVFAVSEGILKDLRSRYPGIAERPMIAVPYGVEVSDYQSIRPEVKKGEKILMRYTGAVSENMLPVIDVLLKAMKRMNEFIPLDVLFTGTTYAGAGLVRPVLAEIIEANAVQDFVIENPARVGYRKALELGMSSDFQLLIGDTTAYYAASKMMGLVASGKPFFAFLNEASFPAHFLKQLQYKDMVVFSPEQLDDSKLTEIVFKALLKAIRDKDQYQAVSTDHPVFSQYTAEAMTKTFTDTFQKVIQ